VEMRGVCPFFELNKLLRTDQHPMPNWSGCRAAIDALFPATCFSFMDLSKGFHQLLVEESSRKYLCFAIPGISGLYRFRSLPMGLKNAPAAFQGAVSWILRDCNGYCLYIDDVALASACVGDHMSKLGPILRALWAGGAVLKLSKAQIGVAEGEFLGHRLSAEGWAPGSDKTKVIVNTLPPTSPKGLRSFLGMVNYFREFIPKLASIAQPLFAMTTKSAPSRLKWCPDTLARFEELKLRLTMAPVLRPPSTSRPFTVVTDVSSMGLGAALLQTDEDGKPYAVEFASRQMTAAEYKLGPPAKEALACHWALGRWRAYLYGTHFTLLTYHSSLKWVFQQEGNAKVTRWGLALSQFDFDVRTIKSESNPSDWLSRQFASATLPSGEQLGPKVALGLASLPDPLEWACVMEAESESDHRCREFASRPSPVRVTNNITPPGIRPVVSALGWAGDHLRAQAAWPDRVLASQLEDKETAAARQLALADPSVAVRAQVDGVMQECKVVGRLQLLYVVVESGRERLVLGSAGKVRREAFDMVHEASLTNHLAGARMVREMERLFYWRRLGPEVRKWSAECELCQRARALPSRTHVRGRRRLQAFDRGELLSIDLVGPFPKSAEGNIYVLSMQDVFSRFVMFVPVPDASGQTVARALVERWYSVFLAPKGLVCDRGPAFKSSLFKYLCRALRIDVSHSSAYYPAGNKVERVHRYLNQGLRTLLFGMADLCQWDTMAALVGAQYNSGFSLAIGMPPFTAMLGLDPVVNLANVLLDVPAKGRLAPTLAAAPLFQQMERVASVARSWQDAERVSAWRKDPGPIGTPWDVRVGELVWFHRMASDRHPGSKGPKRLHVLPGPYRVVQEVGTHTFRLQDVYLGTTVTANASMLSPVRGSDMEGDGVQPLQREVISDEGFVPAEICGARTDPQGEREWQVRWQGFDSSENTWEPSAILEASEAGRVLLDSAQALAAAAADAEAVGVVDISPAGVVDSPAVPVPDVPVPPVPTRRSTRRRRATRR
jgi:hypothetical protein